MTNEEILPGLVIQQKEAIAALENLQAAFKEKVNELKATDNGHGSYNANVAELRGRIAALDAAITEAAGNPKQDNMDLR